MHESGEINYRRRNLAGDCIIGEAQHGESPELPDVGRNLPGDLVSGEVEDSERGEGSNAGGDLAGDGLPVGDDKGGESGDVANLRRDFSGHVASASKLLEDWVLGLTAEVYVGDVAGGWVAVNAVPALAAVGARPGVEDAKVRFGQGSLEGEKCCPF